MMEFVSNTIRVRIPNYLSSVPVPSSFNGWLCLSLNEWVRVVSFGAVVGGFSYLTVKGLCTVPVIGPALQAQLKKVPGFQEPIINQLHKKDCPKLVDTVDIEDLGDKGVFCRCWKSAKFPYCDGAHNQHNLETGDNIGPLIVTNKSA